MRKYIAICFLIIVAACTSKEGNMKVVGKIKGLKKGKLYLQKMQDSVLISVDSISLMGNEEFLLTDDVEDPVMYYLTFDGNTSQKRILFFGEKGTITINDDLEKFALFPDISGSKNQDILEDYYKISRRFRDQNLDLIKENFVAQKSNDEKKLLEIQQESDKILKRRYLYTTNFVLNHADTEAAAYITLTELVDLNVKLLDSIDAKLTDRVKSTTYGKKFTQFLKEVKENEK